MTVLKTCSLFSLPKSWSELLELHNERKAKISPYICDSKGDFGWFFLISFSVVEMMA